MGTSPESGEKTRFRAAARRSLAWARLAGALLAVASPAAAVCGATIFRDAFETGDTSRWANSPAPPRVDGTWRFSIDFDGMARPFVVELVERADGSLFGYLLGGTRGRTMVSGSAGGGSVALELELVHPQATRTIVLAGTLGRATMSLTASGDVADQPVAAERLVCDVVERQLVAAELSGPEPQHLRELAVVLDEEEQLVAGGFVGRDDCVLWACDGGVTAFADDGASLSIGLETDGGCSAGSSLAAAWDAGAGLYVGTSTFHDCLGTTVDDVAVAYGMATSSSAAHDALAGRAALADALEADLPLPSPLPGVAPGYLHLGKDEAALRAELDGEVAAYDALEIELSRARGLATESLPRTFPGLALPFGWVVDERRTGVPVAAGPPAVTYRDTRSRPRIDDFARLGLDGGRWRIVGNQVPALDLPFDSTIPPGGSRAEAPTADGHPVYVSLGPYGGHFPPLTGDPSGEAKANFIGYLAGGDDELDELVGDGDGVREPGEIWGYPAGGDLSGERVRRRRPVYRAPIDGELRALVYERGPTGFYFDDEPQWRLELRLGGEVGLTLGHVGRIAPALRDSVLAATGVDTDLFAGPEGSDLLAGQPPLALVAGAELCLPQIVAAPIVGFPGYWDSGGPVAPYPWTQIEFQVPYRLDGVEGLGGDFCVYRFMTAGRRAELQATMDLDMLDPDSARYRDSESTRRWQWSAQGSLCQAESPLPRDFSSLDTRLGGWYERAEPSTTADELFSFVPVDRTSAVYDPARYDSPAVDHLALRSHLPDPYSWSMPDGTTAVVYYPAAEVLEWGGGAMLLKWRELNATNPVAYQRVAYLLDGFGLKAKWGSFAATAAGAALPTLAPGDPCDDVDTLCYDHARGAWPP